MNSMLVILSLGIGLLPGAEVPLLPLPTHQNISYGPHARNTLDFWQAKGDGPRPLLVYIHGGGWLTGDKSKKGPAFKPFLDKGISCAAFNYRLTPEHPLPAPVHDAARAIQFLRFKARDWNINTSRIALTGPSAGACTSMWLLLHDDLTNPVAVDPVLRESTRVCAASVQVGQTSIDPTVIEGWLGPNVLKHPMIFMAVGESSIDAAMRNYKIHRKVYTEFSPINHLDAKDPPLFMTCSAEMGLPCRDAGHGIHHPVYGVKLKEKSDGVGHECHLVVPGVSSSRNFDNGDVFLLRKLLAGQ
jgi:acetyl esterase/lipase